MVDGKDRVKSEWWRYLDHENWEIIIKWGKEYSDGCTWVPDFYVNACYYHDFLYYWAEDVDGSPVTRAEADHRFRQVIQAYSRVKWLSPISWWRWLGVKFFANRAWSEHRKRQEVVEENIEIRAREDELTAKEVGDTSSTPGENRD